eukprot:CAMPEP_0202387450 /NCGR_PEP_ID=MMETSP1127-20130417/72131_1 /ASSEMBLY_ACC=CAM_ASM_000462 /TAXON_ID=3047 /ORGANISM="Dunaliella tertiolecta, Strain CCMP1320" /LENGTH=44 /DNA_ID= /DNA_START= /DNA_END= /DNA_ORIENTATION=
MTKSRVLRLVSRADPSFELSCLQVSMFTSKVSPISTDTVYGLEH